MTDLSRSDKELREQFKAATKKRREAVTGRDDLASRAGTPLSGATRSLRVMCDHGLVTQSITGDWSMTKIGREWFDRYYERSAA